MNLLKTLLAAVFFAGCGNAADQIGIAAQCSSDQNCAKVGDTQLSCLTGFKGGYCGLSGCTKDEDCVSGSSCVRVSGANYCFRNCTDKPQCNANRSADNEANCVGNADHVGASTSKVCVPPSA